MQMRNLTFILIVFFLLAACSPMVPTPAGAAQSEPPTQPAGETRPTAQPPSPAESAIAAYAAQLFRQKTGIENVESVGVEGVEWPDACLGISYPDVMCAQAIIPGYRITIIANGQTYEFHTNADGSQVMLAAAPAPQVGEVLVEWQGSGDFGSGDFCQTSQIGAAGVAFGVCQRPMLSSPMAFEERKAQLAHFTSTFASFSADTPAGKVTFNGKGSQAASPAEQRAIAEWARLVAMEANTRQSAAPAERVISWSRDGGIAGFCDSLEVHRSGIAYANNCKSGQAQTEPYYLTSSQLQTLYGWIDRLAAFELNQADAATADAMTVKLSFAAQGGEQPSEERKQEILAFAQSIYNEGIAR